ncbi:dihydropteroate synthase [Lacicoccus alkaliphilus]|uniref:Dihydropteroate synthase n=1 Tax=Lacicoccus alkaliphilus DSM 16010 TaxID=1123231 RepID=A0A1M7K4N5_9BACL|nr:dihydropteroate synthase [Salinicoccus alkaliphilus]SHM60151.1 dihydropteroate synthase [Salinicoccus alkaliphilus DSM 16010]
MEKLKIMGILNITPDSFSDGGKYHDAGSAVERAHEMVEEGVDIIDVGGYSTRPGHSEVTEEEEIRRVKPVIEAIRGLGVDISVDTFRSNVAREAIAAGATMINDQWRGTYDEAILDVAAEFNVPIFLMHNNHHEKYDDVVGDMIEELTESAALALSHGVKKENIWLDPGIGFAKTRREELEVMRRLDELVAVGYPVLLATSRKRMIKELIDGDSQAGERDTATAATTIYGLEKGVKAVRVHNIGINRQLADAYVRLREDMDG